MKYLSNGSEVEVIQKLEDGRFVVAHIYCAGDEEYTDTDNVRIVDRVYDEPPREKQDKTIATLEASIKELRSTLATMKQQIMDVDKGEKERLSRYRQIEQLRLLDDFIAGKITHYVEFGWSGIRVIPFNDAKCQYDKHNLKLLTLFGDSKGDLNWKLGDYSDSSGGSTKVVPCTSQEQADQVAREYVARKIVESSDKPDSKYVKWADQFGVPVPLEYRSDILAQQIKVKKAEIANAEATKESAELALKELEEEVTKWPN